MVKVIQENETCMRDMVGKKKCVILFGVKEGRTPNRSVRENNFREIEKEHRKATERRESPSEQNGRLS